MRWSDGVALHDKIQNELIRGTFGVNDPASSKVVERSLNWYGDIERRDRNLLQKVTGFEVAGKRRRGGPKRRWRDCVKIDMHEFGLTQEMTQDRADWKRRAASRATFAKPAQARSR